MKNIVFVLLFIIAAFCLFGCADNSIQFRRDSKFSEIMQDMGFPSQDTKVKKSSGVVIYKDNTNNQPKQQDSNMGFGPGDIVFDMPIKFK